MTNKKTKAKKQQREPMDFREDSLKAIRKRSPKWIWISLYLTLIIVITAIVWSYYAKIDVYVVGTGSVEPSAHTQVVQNLEGGIIKSIDVKEGDHVKKEQVLMRLDDTRFKAAYQKDVVRLAILQVRIQQLKAQAAGHSQLEFSPQMRRQYPDIVKDAQLTFAINQRRLASNIKTLEKNYHLTNQELSMIKPLVKQRILSKIEEIRLENRLNTIKGEIEDRKNKSRADANKELGAVKTDYAVLLASIQDSRDRQRRTVIRSPMNGVVNKLYVTTIGEVIQPGAKTMDIVPISKNLVFLVHINPKDIRFIHPDQAALITVRGYSFSKFGGIRGVVTNVGADTITDIDGRTTYEVQVKATEEYTKAKRPFTIKPGMMVSVKIAVEKKSLFDYLVQPIATARERMFEK